MNLTLKCLAVTSLLISAFTSAQTVYQSKDANGNPVFSDQPKPGAKEVEIKSINTTPAVTPTYAPSQTTNEFKGYSRIGIAVPNPIPNGLTPTTVGIVTEPALRPGDSWQLKLDGGVIASGVESSVTIPKIDRGDHTLQVDIVSSSGVVGSSDPTDVFVFWPGGGGTAGAHVTPH